MEIIWEPLSSTLSFSLARFTRGENRFLLPSRSSQEGKDTGKDHWSRVIGRISAEPRISQAAAHLLNGFCHSWLCNEKLAVPIPNIFLLFSRG